MSQREVVREFYDLSGRRDDAKVVTARLADVVEVREGRVVRVRSLCDTAAVLDGLELWNPERPVVQFLMPPLGEV